MRDDGGRIASTSEALEKNRVTSIIIQVERKKGEEEVRTTKPSLAKIWLVQYGEG